MAKLAIACVRQNDNVASAITGAPRPDQVAGNARAVDHRLSGGTMAGIDEVLADSTSRIGAVAPQVVVVA